MAGHVAGAEPAVLGELHGAGGVVVVAAGDPRPPHLDLAHALAVPRLDLAAVVHDPHVDARHDGALLGADVVALLLGQVVGIRAGPAHGPERRHLRHAPGVEHVGAVLLVEAWMSALGRRRAADGDAADRRDVPLRLFLEDGLDRDPHRRHRPDKRHAFVVDDLDDVARLGIGAAEDLRGAVHHAGEGHAPGIGVEHRHDVQDHVALADAEHVHRGRREAVQVHRRGACRARPWDARWCRTCSTCPRRRSRRASATSRRACASATSAS